VIGGHARPPGGQALRAQGLDLKIYSFPELICETSRDKQRIVIGGSHDGRTSITACILRAASRLFDYTRVGAQLAGFDLMVQLTTGRPSSSSSDEYTSLAGGPAPQVSRLYQHHIGGSGHQLDTAVTPGKPPAVLRTPTRRAEPALTSTTAT
jgi:UDP-N-acetylmuramate: L-alanyl-gamma-D-glutamyl-meso-diaminopimelate ligase